MSLLPIIPEISLLIGSFAILMFEAFFGKKFQNSKRISFIIAIIFSSFALIFLISNFNHDIIAKGIEHNGKFYFTLFKGSFAFNQYLFIVKIALYSLLILFIFSISHFVETVKYGSEFLVLALLSLVGSSLLISSNNLLSFYMSLELQTFPLYIMAAFNKKSEKSSEAALKYFILSAVASGILLFGISLIYGFSASINFDILMERTLTHKTEMSKMVLLGFILVISSVLFKIAAAPFHIWSPDVYQGSPTAATSFFAAITKFSSVIAIVEIFRFSATSWKSVDQIFILTAILSLLVGAFGAIKQTNIKRLFAYSSVGHIGFVLSCLATVSWIYITSGNMLYYNPNAIYLFSGLTIYIIIYSFTSIGVFAFLLSLYNSNKSNNCDKIDDQTYDINSLAGMAKTNPILTAALTILIFSFAGIPPMAGFFAKFYILFEVVSTKHYLLALIAILSSVISCFYYLRIIKIMYFDKREDNSTISITKCNANIVLIICAIAVISAPLYFNDIITLVENNIIHILAYGR
tara:strand:- start:15381 stop:16943 length:1563 start_codon:yes stop_codon:yes gene_type:complete